ncbi:MAG TPA: PIG-L family deacetylase [Cellulomonadaceae bacterium]|nr:PIG-L family deacetylase [Cellulomonadaceae bacterium]
MTGGLLAVHAHPDDETLATGALIASWAAAGLPATVVTCTRGERGEVIPPELAHLEGDSLRLAAHREAELDGALEALGADGVLLDRVPLPAEVLRGGSPQRGAGPTRRYADSGMAWTGAGQAGTAAYLGPDAFVGVPLDEAAARLAVVIRERRPDVVVTYEPGGGYGHPDHIRAHAVTMRALQLAAAGGDGSRLGPHAVAAVLWTAIDATTLRCAWRELATMRVVADLPDRAVLVLPDPDGPLPSVAASETPVAVQVEVAPVLDRVVGALRAHRTQVQAIGVERDVRAEATILGCYALSNGVLAPVLRRESYRFAPGWADDRACWPAGVTRVA